MEHWNIENPPYMQDRKSEQAYIYSHSEGQNSSDGLANYSHPYIYPVMYPHAINVKSQDQLGAIQYCHPVSSYDLNGGVPYNCYNSGNHNAYILPTSRDFFVPMHNGSTSQFAQSAPVPTGAPTSIDLNSNEHSDIHGTGYKRKDTEVVTGEHYQDYSSASSRPLQHGGPNESGFNVMASSSTGAHHLSERSEYNSVNHQQQPQFHASYIGQGFQPSSYGWVGQYDSYSHNSGGYNWNYMNSVSYVNGRPLQSGAMDSMHMQIQEYPAFSFHHPPGPPNQHQHMPSVQEQTSHAAAHCYWRPLCHPQTSNANSSVVLGDINVSSRSPRLPPIISETFNWPLHEASEEYEDAEDSYADSVSDQHGEMRLDIEDMSYEELLALEEQIGDVNTGLSEDSILKNLKTSVCSPLALSLLDVSSRLLNEKCGICLVEYEEQERIGTLDCGHSYHADCIKEWLLIKNLCPICKSSALKSGRGD